MENYNFHNKTSFRLLSGYLQVNHLNSVVKNVRDAITLVFAYLYKIRFSLFTDLSESTKDELLNET